jgi:hypothetical protein
MTTWTRSRIESLVTLMQSAFLHNPTLSLTLSSARRRFGVDEVTCAGVLGALVDAGVLAKHQGTYRRNFPRRCSASRLNCGKTRRLVRFSRARMSGGDHDRDSTDSLPGRFFRPFAASA